MSNGPSCPTFHGDNVPPHEQVHVTAQIGNMSVGKLTAGTMSADVVMGGRFATPLTGTRMEMNSTGFQEFDSGGNLIVSIAGTRATAKTNAGRILLPGQQPPA